MRYLYLLALLLAPVAAHAQATLFAANPSARAALSDTQAEVLGHLEATPAFVSAELGRVQPEALAESGTLRLALPGGGAVTLAPERLTVRAADDRSWYGTGDDLGTTGQFVARDGVMVGTVHHDGRLYSLRPLGDGLHALALLDASQFPAEAELTAAPEEGQARAPETGDGARSTDTIDVIIAYTNLAKNGTGGTASIQALAQLAVDDANQSYANSNVTHRLRLVHTYETPTPQNELYDDLNYLTYNNDSRFDEVHALRDQYGADVVSLIGSYVESCGLGWPGGPVIQSYAFSAIDYTCVARSELAHQIGHNLGAHHNPEIGNNNYYFPYGHGTYNSTEGWMTVMGASYNYQQLRIPYWSSPNVFYNGVPTGDATLRDNVRVLNETALIVATYRPSTAGCQQSLSATLDNSTPVPSETITFAATVSNAAASAAPVDLWLDVSGPVSRRIRFGSGTLPAGATATVNVPLRVPSNAPAGSYDLDLHLGDFAADEVCDTEEFAVTVAPARVAGTGDTEFTTTVRDDLFAAEGFEAEAAATARTAAPTVTVGPNPFRSRTTVRYEVAAPAEVRLAVYDLLGRPVAVLEDGRVEAGTHAAVFDARGLAAGTYVWRLQARDRVETGRLTVLY